MKKSAFVLILFVFTLSQHTLSQRNKRSATTVNELDSISLDGLKWRSVGPALTSGRIADIAVNPNNPFEYYVAVASGGVWKTINSGVTYTPIFDGEGILFHRLRNDRSKQPQCGLGWDR